MLFHVKMVVKIPYGIEETVIAELKAREKTMSQDLQRAGKWLDIWRVVGQYANISLFEVESPAELHEILSSLPLFPFMEIEVSALCRHYSSIKA